MNTLSQITTLDQWQILYEDENALLDGPEIHQRKLIALANQLHTQAVINTGELADLLEQADAAYAWGIEELQEQRQS